MFGLSTITTWVAGVTLAALLSFGGVQTVRLSMAKSALAASVAHDKATQVTLGACVDTNKQDQAAITTLKTANQANDTELAAVKLAAAAASAQLATYRESLAVAAKLENNLRAQLYVDDAECKAWGDQLVCSAVDVRLHAGGESPNPH